jgi:HK97 family phage major capsid protein
MFDLPPDLDEYRSVEELQRLRLDLLDEMSRVEREFDGLPFDDETRDKFLGAKKMIKRVDERISELQMRQQALVEAAGDPRRQELGTGFRDVRAERPASDPWTPRHITEGREAGLRAIDQHAGVLSALAADRLDALVRIGDAQGLGGRYLDAVGSEHYLSAFGKLVADPTSGHLRFSPAEVEAVRIVSAVESQRALAEGTGSSGGFAVPFALDPSIILTSNGALNPIRQLARVTTIVTDIWKGVASDGVVASYAAEAAAATDNSPVLVQPSIDTERMQVFVPFSIELGQDWSSMQQELVQLMTDAKDVLEATKFLLGAGHASNEPLGVLTIGSPGLTTTQRVTSAGAGAVALADIYSLKQALPARFISRAAWAFHPTRLDAVYRFVAAGSTTEPQIFSDGRGGPLLGHPVYEWSTMTTAVATGSKVGLYGDFATGYRIVDRLGMQVEVIPHLFSQATALPLGQRGLYAIARNSGSIVAPNALRYLETS